MDIFWKVLHSRILWFVLFSVVGLSIASYLVLGRGIEESVTQQLFRQEQTIARAETGNIIAFFQAFGNSNVVLSELNSIERRDESFVEDMDAFVEQWRSTGLIGGVVLTDRNGTVQFNSNVLGTKDLGASLVDRDFFIWARDQAKKGEYFISKPVVSRLGASKGQPIIVVASPVYQNGVFTGVIASSVKVQSLVEHFFGMIKTSDQIDIYLADGQGELLYSNSSPDAIGSNISELFAYNQTLSDSLSNALGGVKEGQLQTEAHLITYSPILLGTQNWLFIIFSPTQEVVDLTTPLYVRQIAMLILTAFTILLFGVIAIREKLL